ncbi:MAG: hypothetical protein LBC56_08015 [Oscillospiraceae bacterium]|nr:hypothetical protein [Oscillospiraceae bacterium]
MPHQKESSVIDFLILFFTVFYKYFMVDTQSSLTLLYFAVLALIALMCLVKIYGRISRNEMPGLAGFPAAFVPAAFFVLASTVLSKDANFALPLLIAMAFAFDDIKALAKNFGLASGICLLGHLILFWLGVLQSPNLIRYTEDGIATRNSLGFTHPNNGFVFFMPVFLCAYLLIEEKRRKLLFYAFSAAAIAYIYLMTRTRTGFMIVLAVAALTLISEEKLSRMKVLLVGARFLYFILGGMSLFIALQFGPDVNSAVTKLFTGRPFIWYHYIELGIPLLGSGEPPAMPKEFILPQYGMSVDNYYIYILISFGWVFFVLQGVFYYLAARQFEKSGKVKFIVAMAAFLAYGISEELTIIPSINFSLIYMFIFYINPEYFSRDGGSSSLSLRKVRTQNGG